MRSDPEGALEGLAAEDTADLGIALRVLISAPESDPRVIARVRELLIDARVVMVSIPYHFAEMRFLAFNALAACEHLASGKETTETLRMPIPLNPTQVSQLAEANGIEFPKVDVVEGLVAAYRELRDRGLVPMYDVPATPEALGYRLGR